MRAYVCEVCVWVASKIINLKDILNNFEILKLRMFELLLQNCSLSTKKKVNCSFL